MVSEVGVDPWLLMRLSWCGYSHIWKPWVELSHIGCLRGRMEQHILGPFSVSSFERNEVYSVIQVLV